MKPTYLFRVIAFIVAFFAGLSLVGAQDIKGGKDHPLFTRMTNFFITGYEVKDFDSELFYDVNGEEVTVEGKKYVINYEIREGAETPSPLQIIRNFANAVKGIGGNAYEYAGNTVYMSVKKPDKEVWGQVYAGGEYYTLTVVEKKQMTQEVTAADLLTALNTQGRIALQINFDFGKATIRPESMPVIAEIVTLMKKNASLKISVEGHTDNVGNPKSNQVLSEQRAASVVEAIVEQGIDPTRLSSAGFGQGNPVADNTTEEGRAKNRRVELVKK